jgi:hypothetical protein
MDHRDWQEAMEHFILIHQLAMTHMQTQIGTQEAGALAAGALAAVDLVDDSK